MNRTKGLKRLIAGMLCIILVLTGSAITIFAEEAEGVFSSQAVEEVKETVETEEETDTLTFVGVNLDDENHQERWEEVEEEQEDSLCGETNSILKWSYNRNEHGDCFVDHCTIKLLGGDLDNLTEESFRDEVTGAEGEDETTIARYILEVGQTYYLRIKPKNGYIVRNLRFDDYILTPTEYYGVYSFTMGQNKFRIWDDIVEELVDDPWQPDDYRAHLENRASFLYDFHLREDGNKLTDAADVIADGGVVGLLAEDDTIPAGIADAAEDGYVPVGSVAVSARGVLYTGRRDDQDNPEFWITESDEISDGITESLDDGNYAVEFYLNDGDDQNDRRYDYKLVRTPYEGDEIEEIELGEPSCIENHRELSFTVSNPVGIYTFFRKENEETESPKFHLSDRLNREGEFDEITLEPVAGVSGLVAVDDGDDDDDYTYQGSGDIRLKLKKYGVPLKQTYRIEDGMFTPLICRFYVGDPGENEDNPGDWRDCFDFDVNPDGTVTIPAYDPYGNEGDEAYPIRELLESAISDERDIYAVLEWSANPYPARRVVIAKDYWDEEAADVTFEENDPYVVDKRTEDDAIFGPADGRVYIRPDAKKIRFRLQAKGADKLISVTAKPVDFDYTYYGDTPEEAQYEVYEKEANSQYGGPVVLTPEGGWYEMDLPVPKEWDRESNLGVKIIPNVEERTRVSVTVKDLSFGNDAKACAELFKVSVRVDSKTYSVDLDDKDTPSVTDDEYFANVPVGANVTIAVSSKDGLWSVSNVVPTDASKNNGKTLKASKTGEYSVQVPGFDLISEEEWATKNPSLELQVSAVAKLLITDSEDNELIPENKKYNLGNEEVFNATVVYGSYFELQDDGEIENGLCVPVPQSNTAFKNGSNVIDTTTTLTTTGKVLNVKSLSLKAVNRLPGQNKDTTLSASFTFSVPVTAVTIKPIKKGEGNDEWLEAPYGTKQTFTLTYEPSGANTKNLKPAIYTAVLNPTPEDEWNYDLVKYADIDAFGSYNGKTVTIDPAKAKNYPEYCPGGALELAILDGDTIVKAWSLCFVAPGLGSADHTLTPTIKANDALFSTQEIGLSLTLPKKMKAMDGLYYRVEATAQYNRDNNEEPVPGSDPNDPNPTMRSRSDLGFWVDRYNDEGLWDETKSRWVSVYKDSVVAYIPSTEKTWTLNVADAPDSLEDGWEMFYSVKAQMVYAVPSENPEYDEEHNDNYDNGYLVYSYGDEFAPDPALLVATKYQMFETKLSLTKKMPAKIYTGQMDVPIAIPKWSKTTTVKGLDRVWLVNEYGNEKGYWDRWGRQDLIKVDPGTGLITLDTARPDEEDDEVLTDYLEPGKYDLICYAIAGPGMEAVATIPVTLLQSIRDLSVTAPLRVLKSYGKAATVKADVAYNCRGWEYGAPAVKKVEWSIKVPDEFRADGKVKSYKDIPDGHPLYGMVTVKGGAVTIDKNLLMDYAEHDGDDFEFVVAATAADFEGNPVTGYSAPIVISCEEQIPTEIRFAWEQWRNDVFTGYEFSNISEEEIKLHNLNNDDPWFEPFYSNQIQNCKVLVYDQYGHGMAADLKLSGIKMTEEGNLWLEKPGKVSITATAQDGSKKSKKIEFTISFADKYYVPNVLIQKPLRNDVNDDPFINCEDRWAELGRTDNIINDLPANKPIYVHVAGVRKYYVDGWYEDGDPHIEIRQADHPDFGNNALLDHKLTVNGGKVSKVYTGMLENYTTYVILPEKRDMTVTLVDNTVSDLKGFEHGKTNKDYKVTNKAIPDDAHSKKAPTIKADRKEIYKWMRLEWPLKDAETLDTSRVPNHVTYEVTANLPKAGNGNTLAARAYMDELKTEGLHNIFKCIASSQDNEWEDRLKEMEGVPVGIKDGKFEIPFYRFWTETRTDDGEDYEVEIYDSYEIPVGSYDFYVVIGQEVGENDEFEALAKPVKITVKVANAPAPKLSAQKSYKLTEHNDVALVAPTTTNVWEVDSYKETRSTNTNGMVNSFCDLFHINMEEQTIAASSDEGGKGYIPETWLPVGSGKNVKHIVVNSWFQLKQLKDGEFKAKYDENKGGYRYDKSEDAEPIADSKTQISAYKNFVKTHCTGFIRYGVIGLDGRYKDFYAPVTVDIEAFIDTQTNDPD